MGMNNAMAFQFSTVADAISFAEIYEDVCERQADSVVFDDVPEPLIDEVMMDAQRCEGWRVR